MRALVYEGPYRVRVREKPDPRIDRTRRWLLLMPADRVDVLEHRAA